MEQLKKGTSPGKTSAKINKILNKYEINDKKEI